MLNIGFFKGQPTEHIIKYSSGRVRREGPGLAFYYFKHNTQIVAVPTSSMDANFVFNARTYREWCELTPQEPILGLAPLFHITGLVGHAVLSLLIGFACCQAHAAEARKPAPPLLPVQETGFLNRKIDLKHAQDFKNYLLKNPDFVTATRILDAINRFDQIVLIAAREGHARNGKLNGNQRLMYCGLLCPIHGWKFELV